MALRWTMIGAAALALAACSGSEETAGSSELALQETPNLPAEPAGVVRLRGDGLEVTGPLGTMLTFGSPRETVEAELASAMGEARDVGTNAECGAGPVAFTEYPGGLTLNFQEGALVGWSLRDDDGDGQSADIATAEGIDLASSEAELTAAYEVEMIADSTLGEEFTTPAGIFGFLTGEGAQKEVESLHAGMNCFFR
ncbi:MAG: aspartate-semialdehyde dehydrogenase [Alphaproteobacteria bacterium]|nr:aspartate-semialdehyde dehydrogenase [Alphaproteobacteria bacterium]